MVDSSIRVSYWMLIWIKLHWYSRVNKLYIDSKTKYAWCFTGIGRQLTLKLVETGANVITISRTLSDLESLKNEVSIRIIIQINFRGVVVFFQYASLI